MPKSKYSMKYADGGRAKGSRSKPPSDEKAETETAVERGARRGGLLGGAAGALRSTRKEQMDALGLKDGGKVPKVTKNTPSPNYAAGKAKADGGKVSSYPLSHNAPSKGSHGINY
ncbi:MAG: hypothetical protein KAJ55_09015 [Anaerolineales bacterium]|nr:hypothetical protein [Anaerolineales bacterium]